MTTADRLRAEGRIEERTETLLDLLQEKFESVPADITDKVHTADPDQLRTWTRRILRATTLDEVFTHQIGPAEASDPFRAKGEARALL
ncbi:MULTISPECIES: hypothetical protein [unclassified Nocardia]|uniref:hypothetical protein n=1 Tax=unclassified Nocardia TaxID=2637762 RepID=UPI001CE4A195|nr:MULTISPECIES: hypothetical protein [unclassified Nocardia]